MSGDALALALTHAASTYLGSEQRRQLSLLERRVFMQNLTTTTRHHSTHTHTHERHERGCECGAQVAHVHALDAVVADLSPELVDHVVELAERVDLQLGLVLVQQRDEPLSRGQ